MKNESNVCVSSGATAIVQILDLLTTKESRIKGSPSKTIKKNNMTKPVTPKDLATGIVHAAPEFVIQAFNGLITRKHVNGRARFTQKEVIAEIKKIVGVTSEEIYKNGWLNVEAHYRSVGWSVNYDKPAYNESYDAFFEFTSKGGQ